MYTYLTINMYISEYLLFEGTLRRKIWTTIDFRSFFQSGWFFCRHGPHTEECLNCYHTKI